MDEVAPSTSVSAATLPHFSNMRAVCARCGGRRENIEWPYELTGVGVVSNQAGEVYFTQIFVGQ
jgi:hypothetical protein